MNKELIRKIEVLCTLVEERWGKEYGGSSVGIAGRLATEILNELDKPLPEPIDSTNVKIIWSEETSSQQKDVEDEQYDSLLDECRILRQLLGQATKTDQYRTMDEYKAALLPAQQQDNDVAGDENLVTGKTKVVCFCGSTRFAEWFMIKRWELEKQGIITLGINILPNNYFAEGNSHGAEQEGVKEILDELHKRKIDLSDEVYILNVGGYIGESTRNELNYAIETGKKITYLEQLNSEQNHERSVATKVQSENQPPENKTQTSIQEKDINNGEIHFCQNCQKKQPIELVYYNPDETTGEPDLIQCMICKEAIGFIQNL